MKRPFELGITLVLLGFSFLASIGLFVPSAYSGTPLGGHITQDTTLTLANSPYSVVNDVTVDSGVRLTVEPGVNVEFADGFSLVVNGTLSAVGTADKLINFTSSRLAPSPGVWKTIKFIGGKAESFTIEHSAIAYAANGITIATKDGYALIEKCQISKSSESGIMLIGESNVIIQENNVDGNKNGIATDNSTIHSGIEITGNTFSSNQQNGIYVYAGSDDSSMGFIHNVTFSSNVVSSNGQNGIYLYSYGGSSGYIFNVTFLSNVISSNGQNGIYLYSYPGWHYRNGYIYNVTFSSNTVSANSQNGIRLDAPGIYGSIYDVAFRSNTVSSNKASGIWASALAHSQFAYDIVAVANAISANYIAGIRIDGGINANTSGNSISYNQYGVFYTSTKNNWAGYNDIYRNTYGMNVTSSATVSAEYNYWGDSGGPYQFSLNPGGQGNSVNGNGVDLDFIPWLSAPNGHINERPAAKLTADKTSISVGQTVTFDASASTDDERVDKYFFNFGDGKNSSWTTLSVAKHNYTSSGVYQANLTVSDDFGVESTNTANWTMSVVQSIQQLTVFVTLSPASVITGSQVSVEAHVTNGTWAIQGASVQFAADKGGTFSPASGSTNSTGDFTTSFTSPTVSQQTSITITAHATKTGYINGQGQAQVTVNASQQPSNLPMWLYIGIVVVALVAIGGGVTLARRGHKPK